MHRILTIALLALVAQGQQTPDAKAYAAAAKEKDAASRIGLLRQFLKDYPKSRMAGTARREMILAPSPDC